MEKITLTFEGRNVQIKTEGFTGAGCLKATEDLEKALGQKVKDTKTSEFYDKPVVKVRQ